VINGQKLLALVPARGGSQRLPKKNILELAGKPMICWSIEAAKQSRFVDQIVVSTEDSSIADIARQAGAEVPFDRPSHLAAGTSTTMDVVEHTLEELEKIGHSFEYILLLQPTSPLRRCHHIDESIEILCNKKADAIIGVTQVEHPIEWTNTLNDDLSMDQFFGPSFMKRSQDFPIRYRVNGAIYLARVQYLRDEGTFFLKTNILGYVMEQEASVDVDTLFDFRVAQMILGENPSNNY